MDDTVNAGPDGKKRDLLHTRFAPSVLAVYRSSCLLIAGMRDLARAHPEPIRRWWFFWTTNYAAGVSFVIEYDSFTYVSYVLQIVLASLIIRCKFCHLASAALPVLDGAVSLFEEVQPMFAPANMMVSKLAHNLCRGLIFSRTFLSDCKELHMKHCSQLRGSLTLTCI